MTLAEYLERDQEDGETVLGGRDEVWINYTRHGPRDSVGLDGEFTLGDLKLIVARMEQSR